MYIASSVIKQLLSVMINNYIHVHVFTTCIRFKKVLIMKKKKAAISKNVSGKRTTSTCIIVCTCTVCVYMCVL